MGMAQKEAVLNTDQRAALHQEVLKSANTATGLSKADVAARFLSEWSSEGRCSCVDYEESKAYTAKAG